MPKQAKNAERRVGKWLLGKWHVDRLLDVGGTAAVYEATHRNGNRVALKILHDVFGTSSEVGERFIREGYVANRVQHEGAVTVLDDDHTEDGCVFIVMELLEGESLEQRLIRKERLSPVETLATAARVLEVLEAAHGKGIVHRDIKPANIFLTQHGQVKVLDFGLARVRETRKAAPHLRMPRMIETRDGVVIGTSSYMAPEQARGMSKLIDARTDLWSLGATMFRALSGDVVHLASDATKRLLKAMSEPAPSLATRMSGLPERLVELVDRAVAFQREDRFQSAAEMLDVVQRCYEELAGGPLPVDYRGSVPPPPGPATASESSDQLELSVYYEGSTEGESIVVEYEEGGESREIFLKSSTSEMELSELSVIEDQTEATLASIERPKDSSRG